MQVQVTNRTAAFAGVWAGIGTAIIFGLVMPHEKPFAVLSNNVIDIALLIIFVYLPAYLFVAGMPTTLDEIKFWTFFYSDRRGIFTREVITRWLWFWLWLMVTMGLSGIVFHFLFEVPWF